MELKKIINYKLFLMADIHDNLNKQLHQRWIAFGSTSWIIFYYFDCLILQPYLLFASIIIIIWGLNKWIFYYRNKHKKLPSFKGLFKNIFFVGGSFKIDTLYLFTHFKEFLVSCILFWIFIFGFMYLSIRNSAAFDFAMEFCLSNKEILIKTGGIKGFGLIVGGKISYGRADLQSFSIIGRQNCIRVDMVLKKQNAVPTWRVEKVVLH